MDDTNQEIVRRFGNNKILNIFFIVAFSVIFLYYTLSAPIYNVSVANRQGVVVHIAKGEALALIANDLESKNIIRQTTALKFFVYLFGGGNSTKKGDYLFTKKMPVWSVAWMLVRGHHNIDPLKITLKEGLTNEEMANALADKLSVFRRDLFISDKKSKQGYLFPDTYFFFSMTTADEIVDELSANFEERITPFRTDIANSGHSESDIIKMASLIQKEAAGQSDAPVISGILWKRIKNGMPLQVDADKSTYVSTGLPSRPIGNPGLMAIKAALYPEDSAYFYYLHDKSGTVHYAKTFREHKINITKYLK
ncbi:MAG: endolytic transglycosylase MltG [Patescibacteria group bacterium]